MILRLGIGWGWLSFIKGWPRPPVMPPQPPLTIYRSTVEPRNNSLAFKGSPSIKVNILRFQMIVSIVISPLFKDYSEIKVKNL